MRFQCTQCKVLTEVQTPTALSGPLSVPCSNCGRRYRISVTLPQPGLDAQHYRKVKDFADAHEIDLSDAYSVFDGIMSLEEAKALSRVRPGLPPRAAPSQTSGRVAAPATSAPTGAPRPTPGGEQARPGAVAVTATGSGLSGPRPALESDEVEYDPAYGPAIKNGYLTPRQAAERGERRPLATRVAQRHRLPLDLALQVADNRITVYQALTQKAAREIHTDPNAPIGGAQRLRNVMLYGVATMIVFGLGVHILGVWEEYREMRGAAAATPRIAAAAPFFSTQEQKEAAAVAPPPLTVPQTDSTGQLVGVEGPDPRSVLIAFCSTGRHGQHRSPIEIMPAVPPNPYVRFGIFRNPDQPDAPPRAIRIRKDRESGRWIAGDGRHPVSTDPAPAHPTPGSDL